MKYLWYNLNIAGQYLTCNVFHASYNPGAGFVFLLSHPQHMVIDQHYIAGNFNKSIPNLEEKKPKNGIVWKTHKNRKRVHKSITESRHLSSLSNPDSKTVLILLRKLSGLKNKDQEKCKWLQGTAFLVTILKVIFEIHHKNWVSHWAISGIPDLSPTFLDILIHSCG